VAPRARLLLSSFSLLAAAHIVRHTVAITAITTATIRATTRAITATGGVATIGLGGVIGITAGIMAGGAGTAGAAEVGGMAAADAAGMAADGAGMVTIDLKSSPATFWGILKQHGWLRRVAACPSKWAERSWVRLASAAARCGTT
jgi:hypothetical protein